MGASFLRQECGDQVILKTLWADNIDLLVGQWHLVVGEPGNFEIHSC
jgi:hypothetical protein